ncbi:MAG: Zn-ribbon domain-containing OB-fold protein [Candidatus Helarchaeota archaeon]
MNNNEKITWIKCKKCGLLQFKSHIRCLNCKNKTFENVEVKGDCKLLTYTILRAPPMEFRDKSAYAIGIIEFENGIRALGQITSMENLKIGMKLIPKFEKICDNLDGKEVFAYVFTPIK